jgi:hypothetical protein
MEKILPKAILYPFVGACFLVLYSQYGYLSNWINYPDNPARNENLIGIFLTSVFSVIVWLPALVLVNWKNEMFSLFDKILGITSSLAVPCFAIMAVVLGA